MPMMYRTTVIVVVLLAASLTSRAWAVTYAGVGGAIPDATGVNSPGNEGVATFDIVVPDSGTILDVTVAVNIGHTFIGDLIASIEHVDTGTTVHLFSRVGKGIAGNTFGDGSDLNGVYRFNDGFPGDLWITALALAGDVVPGDFFPSSHDTPHASGGNEAASALVPFVGEDINGTWRLRLEDWAEQDRGSVRDWELTFDTGETAIPEPATVSLGVLALMTLAGLSFRGYKRGL